MLPPRHLSSPPSPPSVRPPVRPLALHSRSLDCSIPAPYPDPLEIPPDQSDHSVVPSCSPVLNGHPCWFPQRGRGRSVSDAEAPIVDRLVFPRQKGKVPPLASGRNRVLGRRRVDPLLRRRASDLRGKTRVHGVARTLAGWWKKPQYTRRKCRCVRGRREGKNSEKQWPSVASADQQERAVLEQSTAAQRVVEGLDKYTARIWRSAGERLAGTPSCRGICHSKKQNKKDGAGEGSCVETESVVASADVAKGKTREAVGHQ